MGAYFKLEHANIVAYLTSRSYGVPRIRRLDLDDFLSVLAYDTERYLISEPFDEPWPREIGKAAQRALSHLREVSSTDDDSIVPPPTAIRLLEKLQSEFADYPLYALSVGAGDRLQQVARDLARMPMYGQLLVLIPEYFPQDRGLEVLDPIPAFSKALHSAPDWPGILFWTQTGIAAFARLEDAESLGRRLMESTHEGRRRMRPFPTFRSTASFDEVLRDWSGINSREYRRLLHLSDLHFGTRDATENQALLEAELSDIVRRVDRVVITGDLFDTPRRDYATLFTSFRANITRLAGGREPISITGNHDQRMIGNFGKNYEQVALIGSRKIVVDDQCQMIFICFNSSERGSLARGRITRSQFRQLGGDYRSLIAGRPELKRYLAIALVHHHPFSFDVPAETWVQRALSCLGLRDETFLEMVDAEDLHHWCLDWKIKTILHGHKHKARYIERDITRGSDQMKLTAIGCGSSLGAEGSPVSYNMLEWDPASQRWIASFFESVNGGAFRETVAAVFPHT